MSVCPDSYGVRPHWGRCLLRSWEQNTSLGTCSRELEARGVVFLVHVQGTHATAHRRDVSLPPAAPATLVAPRPLFLAALPPFLATPEGRGAAVGPVLLWAGPCGSARARLLSRKGSLVEAVACGMD